MLRHAAARAGARHQTHDQAPTAGQRPGACRQRPGPARSAPPEADPADEIEPLAQLHASGALRRELAAAKAKYSGPEPMADYQKMLKRSIPGRNRGLT